MEEEIIVIEEEEEQEIVIIEDEIEYIAPTTQEKTIIPKKEQQIVVPDDGIFALSKVTVEEIPSEYIKVGGTLDITENGEYDVKQYEKANVSVGGFEIKNGIYLCYGRSDIVNELCSMLSPENTSLYYAFYQNDIKEIPYMNTSNVTNAQQMCDYCLKLETIPELDFGKVTKINLAFRENRKLANVGGFKDLGKAYNPTYSENYTWYELDFSTCGSLTHDSLMNVINKLYDIANAGCKAQSLRLGTTNLAKLTEEEIAIAQVKGWTVK